MAEREEKERENTAKMEALVHLYEKKNEELEEKELEIKYRIQMLENTMPALMMWNIWRMMMSVQGSQVPTGVNYPTTGTIGGSSATLATSREDELGHKLRGLEGKLNTQAELLQESRVAEEELRKKLRNVESLLTKRRNLDLPDSGIDRDVELFEKLRKMAKDRLDMDKRIRELELKEKLYRETLEQADHVISELEGQFNSQLKENDHPALADNEKKLLAAQKRLQKLSDEIDGHQLEAAKINADLSEAELTTTKDDGNKMEPEHKPQVSIHPYQSTQSNSGKIQTRHQPSLVQDQQQPTPIINLSNITIAQIFIYLFMTFLALRNASPPS